MLYITSCAIGAVGIDTALLIMPMGVSYEPMTCFPIVVEDQKHK